MSNTKFDKAWNTLEQKHKTALGNDKEKAKQAIKSICAGQLPKPALTEAEIDALIALIGETTESEGILKAIDANDTNLTKENWARYALMVLGATKHQQQLYEENFSKLKKLMESSYKSASDGLEMSKLAEYSIHREKPSLIQKISYEQHLHDKFIEFKSDTTNYLQKRKNAIKELQDKIAVRFNSLINEYMSKNIPYAIAKSLSSKLVETEYQIGRTLIEYEHPTNFKNIPGYDEFKNFQFGK